MKTNDFIANLEKSNFSLAVSDGKIILQGIKNKVTKEETEAIKKNSFVINYIKDHKDELIEYITSNSDLIGEKKSKDISSIYRLSGLQQGMLFHGLYDENAGAYNEQLSCDLIDPDLELIKKSWGHIISRHSILRSGFYYDDFSVDVQCVYREAELPLTVLDYSDMDEDKKNEAVKIFEKEDRFKPFDFKAAPLMRLTFIKLSENRYKMFWTSHHIIYDGWSLSILMGEFLSTYETLASGNVPDKGEEDLYEDYIRYIEQQDKEQQENYWRNYMKGVSQGTLLPFIASNVQRNRGAGDYETLELRLDPKTSGSIESFAQKNRLTINTVFQGVWSFLLHEYTGSNEIVFGVVVSGRPDDLPNVEQRVGLYINTQPLHSSMPENGRSDEWLQEIQKHQVSSRQYQYTPLQDIQLWTGVSGDLFDTILVFENYPVSEVIGAQKWKLQVENILIQDQTNYPLTVIVSGSKEFSISFNYNSLILKKEVVNEIRSHFENVLNQFIQNEDKSLNKTELLADNEKNRLLTENKKSEVQYPKDKNIVDFFEEQVLKNPENIAVTFEGKNLTYRELNERSNRLGHYLQSKGVKTETLVPICIERSEEMIIGILGILKAGGAYVPVDPEYPAERIKFMIEDTGGSVVLSSSKSRAKLPSDGKYTVIETDGDSAEISKQSSENLKTLIDPHNIAYVIYTSGSTGKPKGVLIEHYNVVRLFKTDEPLFDFNEKDVWTLFHSFCFDFSVWEMYGALFYGGKLVIVGSEVTKDASLYADLIISEKVTVLNQTPSAFYVLQDIMTEKARSVSVRYVIFGGEALVPAKVQAWKQSYPECKLINMYGITETTVHVTYQELNEKQLKEESSVIGKPIPTLSAYILNKRMQLVPPGVAGELYIGGAGLARGYLNQPELTKERFIKDPFAKEEDARLYRTGDLGRMLPVGNIEYLGRIDEQVKIRGYRIELGEIESVLQEVKSVKQSVVLAHTTKEGSKRLVGYVVPEGEFDKEAAMNYLRSKLPEYMVPAIWMELDKLPITSNGKTDRKALPDPEASELLSNEYVAPRTETEEKLAAIWRELLGVEKVGVYDNFFELGGHSLMVTRVVSGIRKEFSLNIPIKTLFEFISIADIANYIELINSNQKKAATAESYEL